MNASLLFRFLVGEHYSDMRRPLTNLPAAAHAAGKVQVRGRDYIMEDGDICHFRFNV